MRVAVVSPETIHHRDADETRRLQRLLRGLNRRGHDVTVCCARWWTADVEQDAEPVADAPTGAEVDGTLAEGEASAARDAAPGSGQAPTTADGPGPETDDDPDVESDGGSPADEERESDAGPDGTGANAPDADVDGAASAAEASTTGGDAAAADADGAAADDPDAAAVDDAEADDADAAPHPADTPAAPAPGVAEGHSDATTLAEAAPDPDDLPAAGGDAPGTASGPTGAAPAPSGGGFWNRAPKTVTVDGITYRAVGSDPSDVRGFAARAPLAIRRANPDVIHAVATPPAAVVAARAGATLARAPVVAEWYDPSRDRAEEWTTRQALRRPARIVTPSRLTRRQLLEIGADDADLRVVPNAIDADQIQSVVAADDADVVYARRLDGDANLESLFLGLAELRDRDWSATIVGDGPERFTYEQQAKDLRIEDRVTFVGACDREERLSIYRGAHAFVQTARQCVFATELLWALACGCIGIVEYHADSSAHELVEGRDRGFRTTNPEETADAIREAAELERMTFDDSFASYDEDAVLDQYESLYDEVRGDWGWF